MATVAFWAHKSSAQGWLRQAQRVRMDFLAELESALLDDGDGCAAAALVSPGGDRKRRQADDTSTQLALVSPPCDGKRRRAGADAGDDSHANDKAEKTRPCRGCQRHSYSGKDWLVAGKRMAWALPGFRGLWCRDCHTVWRSVYSGNHSLTDFGKTLEDPNNKAKFDLDLVAYITLKSDVAKVTGPKIMARARALRTGMRLLCLPLEPSAVVPLADVVNRSVDPGDGHKVAGEDLTMIKTASGSTLAVFVSMKNLNQSGQQLERPTQGLPVLRRWLNGSTGEQDAQAFTSTFGEPANWPSHLSAGGSQVEGCTAVVTAAGEAVRGSPIVSRLASKFEAHGSKQWR